MRHKTSGRFELVTAVVPSGAQRKARFQGQRLENKVYSTAVLDDAVLVNLRSFVAVSSLDKRLLLLG